MGSSHSKSIFSRNTITVGKNASSGTLAHELFHELDNGGKISSGLSVAIAQDMAALTVKSGGDIMAYLKQYYPDALRTKQSGIVVLKEPYRGIADILNGMADGKITYGFGHKREYWANPGMLEAEAWAQFGRVYFDNAPDVKKMFEDLFPNLSRHAMIALKGMI